MKLVLDTNVVIDWLVFDDAFLASFRDRVRTQSVQVITHTPAFEELRRVLGYPALKLDVARQAAVLAQYTALVSFFDRSPADVPAGFPRCRDPDDNPFLLLAWQAGAHALVSRDKKVLKLARRARRFGFEIYDVPRMVAMLDSGKLEGET